MLLGFQVLFVQSFVSILVKKLKYFFIWGGSFWFRVCSLEFLSTIFVSANWGAVFNLDYFLILKLNQVTIFSILFLVQVMKIGFLVILAFQSRLFRWNFFWFFVLTYLFHYQFFKRKMREKICLISL